VQLKYILWVTQFIDSSTVQRNTVETNVKRL